MRAGRRSCALNADESARLDDHRPALVTELRLVAVNVGTPTLLGEINGETVYSGIRKHPVPPDKRLWLSWLDLAGDGQADLDVHGGSDKAVYAYPSEHLATWADELGQTLGDAPFGENLSTLGALERDVGIGDLWRWGAAVLQVTQPRWPCFKLDLFQGREDIGARLRTSGRTGWYLRVLEPGEVPVGGPIEVVQRDSAGISVHDAHLAMLERRTPPERLREVAEHPALAEQWQTPLRRRLEYLAARSSNPTGR
jgi:MOSC domain-containing protein YiiM